MNADAFYRAFEPALTAIALPFPMQRSAGRACKWKVPLADGHLLLAFATNAKVAGLAEHWPGEFRPTIRWTAGRGAAAVAHDVSFFQYTLPAENDAFVQLQDRAIAKFFAGTRADSALRDLVESGLPPSPQHDRWFHYFDAEDTAAWGRWFNAALPGWHARFTAAPESRDDWAWRVLWPHLKRGSR